MIKSSSNSSKNSSSTERKLAKKALRRAPNPVRVFSSYDRIFPEWFLAEAQSRLELALLPLQQFFPQRLMLLLLPGSLDSASTTSEVSSTWAIASDTSGSETSSWASTSSGASSSVVLLLLAQLPDDGKAIGGSSFISGSISPHLLPLTIFSNFRFNFHFFKRLSLRFIS